MQVVAVSQESLHTAPSEHWKTHPPPAQVFWQFEPGRQANTQSPPAQDPLHSAPMPQMRWQPPPAHVGEHVPDEHVKSHPPFAQSGEHTGVVHAHPASADAWAPHAGSAASRADASVPPSVTTQYSWISDVAKMAAHCPSSAFVTACWHCSSAPASCAPGRVQ
jgi:hypothetical protein